MRKYLYAALAGIIYPLAFGPFNIWPISFLSIYIWLKLLISCKNPKNAFYLGLAFGGGLFTIGTSWVYISIHTYGNTNAIVAGFLTLLFILLLSIFFAVQGMLLKFLSRKFSLTLIFPTLWIIFELIRSKLFTGFPWLLLGYSQINSPLKAYAPIISVYGISFLIAWQVALLQNFKTICGLKTFANIKGLKICTIIAAIWLIGFYFYNYNWTIPSNHSHKVALMQGNIKPDEKFANPSPLTDTWNIYGEPSLELLAKSDIVIWPEHSVPYPLPYAKSFIELLDGFAKHHNATLILGVPISIKNTDNYYNSLMVVGNGNGFYHKQRLVPFGEYLPLEKYLRGTINFFDIPMSTFISGYNSNLNVPNTKLLPLICYEIAFSGQVAKNLWQHNSLAIVNISEDGWFGNSLGPHQHLDIVRMRALETGKYVLRATTSGISAIIDQHGNIVKKSPQFVPFALTGKFSDCSGHTPWTLAMNIFNFRNI